MIKIKQKIIDEQNGGKTCNICKLFLPLNKFYLHQIYDNYSTNCYSCKNKIDYRKHRGKRLAAVKERIVLIKNDSFNPTAKQNKSKKERLDFHNQQIRNKRINNNQFRLKKVLSSKLSQELSGIRKTRNSQKLLGCSIDKLRECLESKFQPGMSWNNYGEWHIDHIKPCRSFDLSIESEQLKCFHYTNLQPLWAKDNLSKSDYLPNGQRARKLKK